MTDCPAEWTLSQTAAPRRKKKEGQVMWLRSESGDVLVDLQTGKYLEVVQPDGTPSVSPGERYIVLRVPSGTDVAVARLANTRQARELLEGISRQLKKGDGLIDLQILSQGGGSGEASEGLTSAAVPPSAAPVLQSAAVPASRPAAVPASLPGGVRPKPPPQPKYFLPD